MPAAPYVEEPEPVVPLVVPGLLALVEPYVLPELWLDGLWVVPAVALPLTVPAAVASVPVELLVLPYVEPVVPVVGWLLAAPEVEPELPYVDPVLP